MKSTTQKQRDALARTLYIRELQKVVRRGISLLQKEETDRETFARELEPLIKKLAKVEPAPLTGVQEQTELLALALAAVPENDEPFEELRERLLHQANLVRKTKNRSTYKKPKHRHAVDKEYE